MFGDTRPECFERCGRPFPVLAPIACHRTDGDSVAPSPPLGGVFAPRLGRHRWAGPCPYHPVLDGHGGGPESVGRSLRLWGMAVRFPQRPALFTGSHSSAAGGVYPRHAASDAATTDSVCTALLRTLHCSV
ncbi:hypothetical protein AAFF_G00394530 [Aldrovandia affinis]|uniref:Uncharacterized protein n=1 Tax=Aldrovandia affinis TaxID=143900 RepID=A0AAD7SDV6_9TELE|nr:hypothetical protein AAFF_G00394530 [Aldrovandia affinis]